MTDDIRVQIKRRLEKTWGKRVQPHWISPDDQKVCALVAGIGHTACPSAYYRLLVGSILPENLAKVIYLDADVMVCGDIGPLWKKGMNGNIVLAVQDCCIQTNRRSRSAGNPDPYFNSGVMVIDLSAWRRKDMEAQCIREARNHVRSARYNEQMALNICLSGQWGMLPPAWNRQSTIDLFPDWRSSPYTEDAYRQIRQEPAIVHFTTSTKPWHTVCDYSKHYTNAYRQAVARAGWTDWLPQPLSVSQKAMEFFARPHRRLMHLGSAVMQAKRRSHAMAAMLPEILKLTVLHPWTVVTVPLAVARDTITLRLSR
jgi:lipopolysaccharide biosynthesis glycosyltransferase